MALNKTPRESALLPFIKAVRDGCGDGVAVKQARYLYLPHPSQLNPESPQQQERYTTYITNAEWHAFPQNTLATMLGRMRFDDATIELPEKIDYLNDDFDGDGLTLKTALKQCASNVLQVKWHVLLADYDGLADVPLSEVSKADAAAAKPRVNVKQYRREDVIKAHYEKRNGVTLLTYLMLQEVGVKFDPETAEETDTVTYLILAIDDIGYYQQKIVQSEDSEDEEGEKYYPKVGGKELQYIPVQFVTDGESQAGELPTSLGFMKPITDLAYARYNVSAWYKESMYMLQPTMTTSGWTDLGLETFKTANGGRDFFQMGSTAINNLPEGVTADVISADMDLGGYERYFTQNQNSVKSQGGSFDDDDGVVKTAKQASIDSAEQTAQLIDVKNGLEDAFKNILYYCGVFEGIYSPDEVSYKGIVIDLVDDFSAVKLTAEEVNTIVNLVMSGLITEERAINELIDGGWLKGDAEKLVAEAKEGLPSVTGANNNNETE
jgi:hypothetical protein